MARSLPVVLTEIAIDILLVAGTIGMLVYAPKPVFLKPLL
jgi:hypothetical protein